ncbi:MAG TPA: dienelactone hydrolase family protein, partial [Blastocatellia bacterium]|nr:dienelactone hydrolase family protein [Blastocatellia bacterium]
ERMKAALKAASKPSDIVVYPEAAHGFNADYRPGYNKEAAQDGWKRMLEWFKKNGAA